MKLGLKVFLGVFFTTTAFALSGDVFTNLDDISSAIGLDNWAASSGSHVVKIAVLDNGFKGYQAEIGKSLPSTTIYHAGPIAVDPATEETHGLAMAQVIVGLLERTDVNYQLHLFSAYGYSNLAQAVKTVAAQKFDLVLYAQVWEYGGNGDGHGFINTLVNQATSAGVLWVNASGNFGDSTYRAPVVPAQDSWAQLPGLNNGLPVRCQSNDKKTCAVRVVLSWNSFSDDVNQGTDKDLDLVMTDDAGKIIETSGLTQKKVVPDGEVGSSLYPREIIEAQVAPGLYYLRVKIRSTNFGSSDELRVTVSGDFVQLLSASKSSETLLSPADNKTVITIGASDSVKTSMSIALHKPELTTDSLLVLPNGDRYMGTSNSAAIAAAAIAVLKSAQPSLTRAQAITELGGSPTPPTVPDTAGVGSGLPLAILGFEPTGPACFVPATLPQPEAPLVQQLISRGAVPVETDSGIKIFVSVDPFTLQTGLSRTHDDDVLSVGYAGYNVVARAHQMSLGGQYEVVQEPLGQTICAPGIAATSGGSPLHMSLPGSIGRH